MLKPPDNSGSVAARVFSTRRARAGSGNNVHDLRTGDCQSWQQALAKRRLCTCRMTRRMVPDRPTLLLAVSALVSTGALANPDGAPPGHTGGSGQSDCSSCHYAGPEPARDSGLKLEGGPEKIEAEQLYELTLILRDPASRVGAFQLMIQADDDQTGELIPDDNQQVLEHEGVQYLQHARPQPSAREESTGRMRTEWTVHWRAPPEPGDIRIFVAAVAGNDDNSPLGDNTYELTESFRVDE